MGVKICLNMIVKNESEVIQRCLLSAIPIIDYWVICDTGSSDNTREIIEETLKGIPGELHQHEWINFGANRTKSLLLAKDKADYLLFMDADMIVNVNKEDFKSNLNADSYLIQYTGGLDYWQTMLINTKFDWQYIGATHEYIYGHATQPSQKLDAISLTHFADGGERSNKFTRDIELLKAELVNDPNNLRTLFYLAQSFCHINEYEEAIHYYKKRIETIGWEEEHWYSMYQIACLHEKSDAAPEVIHDAYLRAYEVRPTRVEPLYRLIKWLRIQKRYSLGLLYAEKAIKVSYPQDILFIEKNAYEYQVLFEYAICAHYAGEYENAIQANDLVIGNPETPYDLAKQATANKRFSLISFIEENQPVATKRLAFISYDLEQLAGSGISLKNIIAYLNDNNWPIYSSDIFPEDTSLIDFKPQILISQQWATIQAYKTSKSLNIPMVSCIRGGGQFEYYESKACPPDYLIFNSTQEYFKVKNQYPDIKGIVSHPIIIPPTQKSDHDRKYITLIGTSLIKGVDIFIKIAKRLPQFDFLLVGEQSDDIETSENVTYYGATSNMADVYAQTKILLIPSINESYGRVLVEAAYHGIVSIATDCRGIREASNFENAVYVSERENIDQWVSQVKHVANNLGVFEKMAENIVSSLQTDLEMKYVSIKISNWVEGYK